MRVNVASLHCHYPSQVKNLKRIFIAKPAVQIHQFALAWQLRRCFGPFPTHFVKVHTTCYRPTGAVRCDIRLSDAVWCLQSDAMPNFRHQAREAGMMRMAYRSDNDAAVSHSPPPRSHPNLGPSARCQGWGLNLLSHVPCLPWVS